MLKENLLPLKASALFAGIADADLSPLLSCLGATIKAYAKNQTVFLSGDTPANLGVVLSGQVQVFQEDYYGNKSIFAHIAAGGLFAEAFAFAQIKALPVSVMTTTESELLFIDCKRLSAPCMSACAFHSRLIGNMMGILARKNIALTQKLELAAKRTTREKLMAYLSAEAKRAGSGQFYIPFNRQELADYLCVERSAMSAELGKLRDEGVMRFHKNEFELL